MAETETPTDVDDVTLQWLQIANAVAWGRLSPEEGVAELKGLAEAHPGNRDWLNEEIDIIERQFALDVVKSVRGGREGYWDKLRLVIRALLDERLDHDQALQLLKLIDLDHPEHAAHTARLVDGIAASPLRRAEEG
jgi:hypothetical protein